MEAEKDSDIADYLGLADIMTTRYDGNTTPDTDTDGFEMQYSNGSSSAGTGTSSAGTGTSTPLHHIDKSPPHRSYRDALMRYHNEARKRSKSEQRASSKQQHQQQHRGKRGFVTEGHVADTDGSKHVSVTENGKQSITNGTSNGHAHRHTASVRLVTPTLSHHHNSEGDHYYTNGTGTGTGTNGTSTNSHHSLLPPEEHSTYPSYKEAASELVEGVLAITSSHNWRDEFAYVSRRAKEVIVKHWRHSNNAKYRIVALVLCVSDVAYFALRLVYLLVLMLTTMCLYALQTVLSNYR